MRRRAPPRRRTRLPCSRHPARSSRPPPSRSRHRARPPAAVFRLYDVDGDGSISEADLRSLLGLIVGSAMTPAAMSEVVARTLAAADADGDGRISFEDFESSLETFSWFALTVPVTSSSRWERRLERQSRIGAKYWRACGGRTGSTRSRGKEPTGALG